VAPEIAAARPATIRLLLVEDDDGDALLVEELLGTTGAPVELVRAQTLLEARGEDLAAVDCVLLDLDLPDAHGLSALHRLKGDRSELAVLVLTGLDDEQRGIEAVAAGAQDYLVKGQIDGQGLARAVRYAVERRRADEARQQLELARLHAEENARLERGLLPTPLLRSALVACQTYYQPGSDLAVLGGDFFDVVETADGRVRAVIGDVMGHGPDEAALGVHLRVAWRSLVLAGVSDDELIPTLARLYAAESSSVGGFVTVCDVSIDPDLTVTTRVAGHPAPLLSADGAVEFVPAVVGPPLGLEHLTAGSSPLGLWPATTIGLPPQASLLLYTDGLLECYRNVSSQTSLGVEELLRAARHVLVGEDVSTWISRLVNQAPCHSPDDTAVVVLRLQPELVADAELVTVVQPIEPLAASEPGSAGGPPAAGS
jgi:serine phosphatase RsbU (regulator of sigma subunit)